MIRLVILGAPRTKKNHGSVIKRGKRKVHIPSEAFTRWQVTAAIRRPTGLRFPLPDVPYNCAAVFYRDRNVGDAVGYYQGLADLLEARGILTDDKFIAQWDGSRLLIDAENPRVELTLTEAA